MNKLLTFSIADERYGVPVGRVREVLGVQRITHLPNQDPAVIGIIYLRGAVVPVIDARLRLNVAHAHEFSVRQ